MARPAALPQYTWKVLSYRIHDGDTVIATCDRCAWRRKDVDLGFHDYVQGGRFVSVKSIRLLGINAPELATPEGIAATRYLGYLLDPVPAGALTVATHLDQLDKYGRLLGVFWGPGQTTSFNDQMIAAGQAVPYFGGAR